MAEIEAKEVVFFKSINEDSINWLFEQCANQKKIKILLHSTGGETGCALAFYEYIKLKKIDLQVHVLNACMSAAIIILCAAKKRTAAPNARFVLHNMKKFYKDAEFGGKELQGQVKDFETIQGAYNGIVSKVTRKSAKKISILCNNETSMNSHEAFELGLLTEKPY